MIDDSRNLSRSTTIRGDVCVVGAGPAGLALALELERSGVRVVLLESGGFEPDYRTQRMARAVNAGLPYFPLDANRQRALGGTSRLWAGWCRPFTRWDMTPRLWVDESTWPISIDDIEPFYSPALRFLGLENPNFELPFWEDACRSHRIAVDEGDAFTGIYQLTEPAHGTSGVRLRGNFIGASGHTFPAIVCFLQHRTRSSPLPFPCQIRTLIALELLGAREKVSSFPPGSIVDKMTTFRIPSPSVATLWEELEVEARERKRTDLSAGIEDCLARFRETGGVPEISGFKKWKRRLRKALKLRV